MRILSRAKAMLALGIVALAVPLVGLSTPASAAEVTASENVVAGYYHSCVVTPASTISCWGGNQLSQLGNASDADSGSPVTVAGISNASSVANGGEHSCALLIDRTVKCWGDNSQGQSGQANTAASVLVPTAVAGVTDVVALSSGNYFNCALKANGTIVCWGRNDVGELGAGSLDVLSSTPLQVTGITTAVKISAGKYHACALLADATMRCWGANPSGELGIGIPSDDKTKEEKISRVPVAVPGMTRVASMALGFGFTCARKTDRTAFCWGFNNDGELGSGRIDGSIADPQRVLGLTEIVNLQAGYYHACATTSEGKLYCWGKNESGQLGNGQFTTAPTPTPQLVNLSGVVAVGPGQNHTCAVLTTGAVSCFGDNARGALGQGNVDGIPTNPPTPGAPNTDSAVPKVVSGVGAAVTAIPVTPSPTPGPIPAPTDPTQPINDQPYRSLAAPKRLLDTRNPGSPTVDGQFQGLGTLAAGGEIALKVTGRGSVADSAVSVLLNVTVVAAKGEGYITVYPCGTTRPEASNLNFTVGTTIANTVIAKVGANGTVCLWTSAATDLLADASGYFPTGSAFTPLAAPQRIMETRPFAKATVDLLDTTIDPLSAGQTYELKVTGRVGVPATATAVALNVTAIGQATAGFLTVSPCGVATPNASNVNYGANQIIPNFVLAKVGTAGKVCIFSERQAYVLVDIAGYYTGNSFEALAAPTRYLDTRAGTSTFDGGPARKTPIIGGASAFELKVGGRGSIASSASSVLVNVTVTNPIAEGFVTLYPCGQPQPNASNVNFAAGQTIANAAALALGAGGNICIFSSVNADVILDVSGTLS